jgi:hypothetical protein
LNSNEVLEKYILNLILSKNSMNVPSQV